jgi:superfamily I DNA/RNA helicase
MAESIFTAEEEKKSVKPLLLKFTSDEEVVKNSFARAERLASELGEGRWRIALVVFDETLFQDMKRYAESAHKPLEIMKERGDIDVVRRAQQGGRFVLSLPDYVGGLEFACVLLVGIDQGRVPPNATPLNQGEMAFFSYQAHSRLYVAITRAKYRVEVLCNSMRGPSRVLDRAIASNALLLG